VPGRFGRTGWHTRDVSLHCAATFLIAHDDEQHGRLQSMAQGLRRERVAAVAVGSTGHLSESAARCAEVLDVPLRRLGGLTGGGPSDGAGGDLVAEFREALQELADLHRGETVLVLTEGRVISAAVPSLAGNLSTSYARERPLPAATPVRLEVGDDGWRCVDWPT